MMVRYMLSVKVQVLPRFRHHQKFQLHGDSVMVKGTVTDQTPTGRRNVNNELEFSLKDTPAISDEDMQAWMQYKFMGQA